MSTTIFQFLKNVKLKFKKELGRGNFGKVYLAADKSDKFFAVKEVKSSNFLEREWECSQKLKGYIHLYL
jgi:serine/threonine protein kinase